MSHYYPNIDTANCYYPFGMIQPGRTFDSPNYRYGFNGMEKDDEVKGSGNSLDFGARVYDPRIGRFFAMDPLTYVIPALSPYQFAANSPIMFIDENGEIFRFPDKLKDDIGNEIISSEEDLYNQYYILASDEVRAELDVLASSEVVYEISLQSIDSNGGGITTFDDDKSTKDISVVHIAINNKTPEDIRIGSLADELTHAYQFETDQIGFIHLDGGINYLTMGLDMKDEALSQLRFVAAWYTYTEILPDEKSDLPVSQRNVLTMYLSSKDHGDVMDNYFWTQWFVSTPAIKEGYYDTFVGKTMSATTTGSQGLPNASWQSTLDKENDLDADAVVIKRKSEKNATHIKKDD